MSVTNESRIRSWFQFTTKSSSSSSSANTSNNHHNNNRSDGSSSANNNNNATTDDDNNQSCIAADSPVVVTGDGQQQASGGNSTANSSSSKILDRVTSFRRSLGKAQNKKNKIRASSVKGLTTSAAVEQPAIAKSKISPVRKGSSPTTTTTVTSSGSAVSANCDDDEIYGFTSANFDSSNSNSTRRQLKSSLASNACNPSNASCNAPNISAYESESNKSGRVRNDERDRDERDTIPISHNTTAVGPKGVVKDSPERCTKSDKEFGHTFQQQPNELSRESIAVRLQKYYKQQYRHDSDLSLRHPSAQRLSWIAPNGNEIETEVDRIYENMRDISSAFTNAQIRHQNRRNSSANASNLYANSVNNLSDNNNIVNNNNRKLTKDSGYESASASIPNWGAINANNNANNANALANNYFHSRSDSNASSVSNGGGLSPRTAANSAHSAYNYCDQWSAAKSTSNLPLQVHVSGSRRSSLSGSAHPYPEPMANTVKSGLPAKSVPGGLDRDSDDNLVKKRSHNRNNPTPSSVYSLLASKSGLDFAPVLKSNRKSCGPSFADQNAMLSKYNERVLSKTSDSNASQFWKARDRIVMATYGQESRYDTDDSPPPTPPVRDSSLSSNRKFNCDLPDSDNKLMNDSLTGKGGRDGHYYKNNNSQYYMKSYSDQSRVSHMGCSKSLINLRSKYDDNSDLKQFSQTYPLLPETEFNDKSSPMQESWSCDQSVTSGVTSLVTSDYFTASSSVITHSPSLSSLSTTATNTTTASYNNSRNSIASTGSSSQIAKSSKVVQPKRESASVLFVDKSASGSPNNISQTCKSDVPPPPPPKLHLGDYRNDKDLSPVRTSNTVAPKMVSTSRTIETSKTHQTSDPEIKAIQKRAVYQFYLKQKQKEKQQELSNNSNINHINNNSSVDNNNSSQSSPTLEDNSQIQSRKVQLVVHENIYENSSAHCMSTQTPPLPSPPLPPPPHQTVADIELDGDLPLPPPPPIAHECESPKSATTLNHSNSHNIDICDPYVPNCKPYERLTPSPPKDESLVVARPAEVWHCHSSQSEIATQTTDTLHRHSSCASAKDVLTHENKLSSHETSEPMYENSVLVPINQMTTTGEHQQQQQESGTNKSMEWVESDSVVPWAYSKLWPNEKCVNKIALYESDYSYISSPIVAANTFIGDTGVGVTNEELLPNKSDLISRLSRKLDVLRSEEMTLTQDVDSNEVLGQHVRTKLKALGLTEQESEKINLHCEEIEKVTRLLLSISARLRLIDTQIHEKTTTRQQCLANESQCKHKPSMAFESTQQTQTFTQNDLQHIRDKQCKQNAYSSDNLFGVEIQSLVCKRQKLLEQLDEALQLRVCIDQRNHSIEDRIIRKYFKDNYDNLNEFLEFIQLKSKLIVNIREVKDKILMGEKYLCTLRTIS